MKEKNPPEYYTWKNMFKRCYSTTYQLTKPSYKGCIVCKDWWDSQTFIEWYSKNKIEGFQLDKDILIKGNKIYSPETCCFVPREINMLFAKSNSIRGELPIGVRLVKSKFRSFIYQNNKFIHLGYYNTSQEAFNAYKIAKESHIKAIADKWKDHISKQVYNAMYNYIVEITD